MCDPDQSEFKKVVYEQKFRLLFSEKEIEYRIRELGKQVSVDYSGKCPVVIGVLNGGFVFMADLIRRSEIDLEVDFIKISSYGDGTESTGHVKVLKDINTNINKRHVLLVEDIVDTGLSVQFLLKRLSSCLPASLKLATFLWKRDKAKTEYKLDYVGFEIPDHYVVGYGLDHKQMLRNLPAVYVME